MWERRDRVRLIDDPIGYLYRTAMNASRGRFRRLTMAAKRTIAPGEPEDPFAAADLRDELVRAPQISPRGPRARRAPSWHDQPESNCPRPREHPWSGQPQEVRR